MNTNNQNKQYYTIGEVAHRFGISIEVLRKWEHDFPTVIKPQRTKGETRFYSRKDVEKVALVHRLLRVEKLTIAGAKKKLGVRQTQEEIQQEVISRLFVIRQQLADIVSEIDALSNTESNTSQLTQNL